ncbi:hypothetical protein [Sorangium sp. So ce204]|uniref:hypothetical protein n=1 Tax=Sorangium sp. So ce204 TaxID=3133288 RepID=UPI003F61A0EA
MDSAAASAIARWIDLHASRPDLPLRLNMRLLFGSSAVATAVRAELEARNNDRRQFFVRRSEDDDAVFLRNGRPRGVGPATTVVYVLFWLPGSDGHARNAQSLQDLRGFHVHDLLGDEALEFDGERRIAEQIAVAAATWTAEAHRPRAKEHLGAAWEALRRCLRFGSGGREGSVPYVRSLSSWLRFLDRAAVPQDAWAALPDCDRAAALVSQWGAALPELQLFRLSELAAVLGVTTDPTQPIPRRSATGEGRWLGALQEMLGQNLEVALDPTGLGELIAGNSSLEDQLDKVLPAVHLCRTGDQAAARKTLERFCLEGDEQALGVVEWLFHQTAGNRRSPSMGLRGVLVARRSRRDRRTPLERARDETFAVLEPWLGEKTPEMDVVRDHVHHTADKGALGYQAIADLLEALAGGAAPEEPAELRKALEKALAAPTWNGDSVRRLVPRWRRLRQGTTRERDVKATSVLSGLVELVRQWKTEEASVAAEGAPAAGDPETLIVRFEERDPVEIEIAPATQDAAAIREALARFLREKVRAAAFPDEPEPEPEGDDPEHRCRKLAFTVERAQRRDRELIGRIHVEVTEAARDLWQVTCRSPLAQWRIELEGEPVGSNLLRQIGKEISGNKGTRGVSVDERVDAAWSAYVREGTPRGAALLSIVAPIPASARIFVEAWSAALDPIMDAASASSSSARIADLEAEQERALDAGDMTRLRELHRLIQAERAKKPATADVGPMQARHLLSLATVELLASGERSRALLTPHHPLVLRLRGVEDDFLIGLLQGLWTGGWRGEEADDLKESLDDWGLPEPAHAWCAWDGDPLAFEAWLDGGSALFSRLGASREDDAASLGARAAADIVRRYRDLYPLAADRLRIRIQADRAGRWAQRVIEEGLDSSRAYAADIDLITDLPERSMTALERELLRDGSNAEPFELGTDGTLPRVRVRRVAHEPLGSPAKHLALVVGEKIDALAAEWQWQPPPAVPAGADPVSIWSAAVLFDESLPQVSGLLDTVAGPQDALSVRAALAMGMAKGSQPGTIPVERQSFDPSRCEVPIVAAQGSAHWLVLASRRPLYRAVQQVGPRVATLLDFQTRTERGRPLHVCISLGVRHAPNDVQGLAARLRDLVGEADADVARALLRRAQKVAPELALRCLGTAGGAELIGLVGLLLAAGWLEEQGGEGMILALDQHRSLVASRTRGDLLLVSDVQGAVRLRICEAKCSTLPLAPNAPAMVHAIQQIQATIRGLAHFSARHALAARTRLKLARALIEQAHMLGVNGERSTAVMRLVDRVRDPSVPIEIDQGPHIALGFSLQGMSDAHEATPCGELRVFGRPATLARLQAMVRAS